VHLQHLADPAVQFERVGLAESFALIPSRVAPRWHPAGGRITHTDPVTPVRIRAGTAADLPALRRLFRRSSLHNEGDRESLLAHPEALELADDAINDGRTQVAVGADDEILGFITTLPLGGRVLEIEDLFVDPQWMRKGVGTQLVKELMATAHNRGIGRIEVTANPHAGAFYRSVGFAHDHDTETQFGPAPRLSVTLWRAGRRETLRRRVAELCLELPGATEEVSGRHATYLVARRKFVYLLDDHHGDGRFGLCVRATEAAPPAAVGLHYTPAYIGRQGWIGLDLAAGPLDWTDAAGLILGSYLLVAPRRLASQVAG
jgi:GNAT superfamily N-acetyltransferase